MKLLLDIWWIMCYYCFSRCLETLDRDSGYTTFISLFGTSITLKQMNPCAPHPPLQETSSSSLALFILHGQQTIPSSFLFRIHMLTILLHLPSSNFYQFSSFLSILQYDSLLATMTKRGTCQHFPLLLQHHHYRSLTFVPAPCKWRWYGKMTRQWPMVVPVPQVVYWLYCWELTWFLSTSEWADEKQFVDISATYSDKIYTQTFAEQGILLVFFRFLSVPHIISLVKDQHKMADGCVSIQLWDSIGTIP